MKQAEKMQAEDRRVQIISRSTDLFLEQGFAGTSMSMIAKRCGITKASLYHHFNGKDELFVACVTSGYQRALDALTEIIAQADRPAGQKLAEAMTVLYDITISSSVGRMSPLIAEVSRTFPNVARSFHSEYIAPQQDLVWNLIEAGQASGEFKDLDRGLLFHMLFGPIVTLSLSREMFSTFDDLDEHFPVGHLRDGHLNVILGMLRKDR
ncbi:TetR/AcrR family transcriptional regulator [Cognatishimia sp. F0-27]|uniref:TetR/AcrR family transcriptional regulator n=1 Tax=Cognatishimia sp. F0-27 TaxID=2816855 RepID=UPI001D0C9FD8|nr:TetR/AcrR family transcriptional regulator [Cognatishimia sp. F0-27]MCC1495046.1 TetR/AcrR family transcriptional regulator [Cognatishimia sp. F0-27]